MKFAIGTDIEEILRFEGKTLENDRTFFEKIFTPQELGYCFSKINPSPSLCARFCAKESVVKALSEFDIHDVFYSEIEIINKDKGKPVCVIKKYPDLNVKISLSHCKDYAMASALIIKD